MHAPTSKPSGHARPLRGAALALCAWASLCASGCYNGDALVERARSRAIRTRLEEVDLGKYRITLPPDSARNEMYELRMHFFAHAARHKVSRLLDEVEEKSYLIRDRLLSSIRAMEPEEFEDPELAMVKSSALEAVNGVLEEPLFSSLGLYEFHLSRH